LNTETESGGAVKDKEGHSVWYSIRNSLPWRDFFIGLFIPLNLMYVFFHLRKPLLAVAVSVIWCIVFATIDYIMVKKVSVFPIMTGGMILVNFATSFLGAHPTLSLIIEALDNSLIGFVFLGSLLFTRPFILQFIDEEAIKRMPEKIRKTSYFMRTWRIVTAVWGIAYIASALFLTYLKAIHFPAVKSVDYFLGWPIVLLLLFFSVTFPRWYWKKNMSSINEEGSLSRGLS